MKLDPTLSPARAHQILLRRAGQTFGPARTFELNDALEYAASALSRIAREPLPLTGFPPDQSGEDDRTASSMPHRGTASAGDLLDVEEGAA